MSAALAAFIPTLPAIAAVDSATIVPGSLNTTGSMLPPAYAQESNSLRDFPRDTGSFGTDVYPVTLTNGDYNGNDFGGTPNTIVAFGRGGGVTLKLDAPIHPLAGQKELGLFTAQFINSYVNIGSYFPGAMSASILVSGDGVTYRTLSGQVVAGPTTYTGATANLNTPSLGFRFNTLADAYNDGGGVDAATLAALPLADYTVPTVDDNVFNGTGTDADRAALANDASAADYAAVFGTSAGGNWFDISATGLASIQYVRLNGTSDAAVRLDGVFANTAAVPEPVMPAMLGVAAVVLRRRR